MNTDPLKQRITHTLTDQQVDLIRQIGTSQRTELKTLASQAESKLRTSAIDCSAKLYAQTKHSLDELANLRAQPVRNVWRACWTASLVFSVVCFGNAVIYPHSIEWVRSIRRAVGLLPPSPPPTERVRLWVRTEQGWQLLPLREIRAFQDDGKYELCLILEPPPPLDTSTTAP